MESDFIKLKDIKPALTGYINEAETILKASEYPDEEAVHDVRVLMKKARAALRVTMPQIDREFADREMMALREVGRIMSSWRNTAVVRKTLKELKKKHPDIFIKLRGNEKINTLLKKPEEAVSVTNDEKIKIDTILEILKKTGYHFRFEPITNLNAQLLLKELEVTYNRVVNDYLICRNYHKPSKIHELRKSSKDFLYQLWFFRPLNVPSVKSLEKRLESLARYLGKYNDLTQLLKELDYRYEYTANPPELDELAVIIKEEQDRCLSKVWPIAHKIYCPGQKLVNLLGFKLLVI
ncbi:MAG: CHAD domain-containing protein [Bacteroidales bacterium]|nr:CHAD domain-containing protein [Bacteroidales bacterium]